MKLLKVDEAYLTEPVYESWPELSDDERQEMLQQYQQLLPNYINKAEKIIGKGARCPMDILHDAMLKGSKAKIVSEQRTARTNLIRESQKHSDYLSQLQTTCEQVHDFDAKSYMDNSRDELSKLFKLNF